MTTQTTTTGAVLKSPAPTADNPAKRIVKRPQGPHVTGGSKDARRVAAAVLEVMAGIRTPADAATALAVSMPRYYILEKRALEGLIAACEPRAKGPGRRPDKEAEQLRLEVSRLQQDVARYQSLARAAQRTIGLAPPVKPNPRKADAAGKGNKHRRRRPVVRALKVINRLQSEPVTSDGPTTAGPGPTVMDGQP
jgi:hypothetical protein